VRGYGLVDSPKVDGEPGKQLICGCGGAERGGSSEILSGDLLVLDAEDPDTSQFGGDGDIPDKVKQATGSTMKNSGASFAADGPAVHARSPGLGDSRATPGLFGARRPDSGALMVNILAGQLAGSPIKYFADWTERVGNGELPKHKPTRRKG
jgi:hypothetical protein